MIFLSYFVFGLSILFLVLGVLYFKRYEKNKRNYLFFGTIFGSFLWGLGYSLLIVQHSVSIAVIWRAVGLLGALLFSVCGVNLVGDLTKVSKKFRKFIFIFSLIGLTLYPFLIMPERLVYKPTLQGMDFSVVPDLWNTLYNVYSAFLFIILIISLIKMRKNSLLKREKSMNNGLWLFFLSYLGGIVIEIILVAIGFGASPCSTISQFIAVYIIYKYLIYQNNNSLTWDNIFNHIYSSIEMPIMIFDNNRKFDFGNESFYNFFNKDKSNCGELTISDLFVLQSEDDVFKILGDNFSKECFTKESRRYCSLTVEKIVDSYDDLIGYIILVNDLSNKLETFNRVEIDG